MIKLQFQNIKKDFKNVKKRFDNKVGKSALTKLFKTSHTKFLYIKAKSINN
jgi:hypothetical protein